MDKQAALLELLQRTNITVPFLEFLAALEQTYPQLGKVRDFSPIAIGYESANIFLSTEHGEFVVKIFEKERNPNNIESLVRVHEEAAKVGVPVPELISGETGHLSSFLDHGVLVPYFVTRRFWGETFEKIPPTRQDMSFVCESLARLNTLNFPATEEYDSWGCKNLVHEYEAYREHSPELTEVAVIVEKMRSIPWEVFTKGVIHGDMQRKHALKSKDGRYCILDFGCMSFDALVLDFSIFLAWFCLSQKNWSEHQSIIKDMLHVYEKHHTFSDQESAVIPLLIQATYAAYFLKTTQLIQSGDSSEETSEWNRSAQALLQLASQIKMPTP